MALGGRGAITTSFVGPYGISNVQTMQELKKWAKPNRLFANKSIIPVT
jgi:hypothetical protein